MLFKLVQRHDIYCCIVAYLLQPGVKTLFSKIDHKPNVDHIVVTLNLHLFYAYLISTHDGNRLIRTWYPDTFFFVNLISLDATVV